MNSSALTPSPDRPESFSLDRLLKASSFSTKTNWGRLIPISRMTRTCGTFRRRGGAGAEIRRLEAAGDFGDPRYMELLVPNFYMKHICRLPEWPDPVNRAFAKLNQEIRRSYYVRNISRTNKKSA
jgi:hypothetical protein